MSNESLSERMKEYEQVARTSLLKRVPAVLRLDGKSFSNYTRRFKYPFDENFRQIMAATAIDLCREIQGAKLAYTQSDEISIIMTDYDSLKTQGWFDYQVQKVCSVSASICTGSFIKNFINTMLSYTGKELSMDMAMGMIGEFPAFDARVFSLPTEQEVVNYLIFRQQDATRNSIQMLGRSVFSHKQLLNLTGNDIQEKLMTENGINWNDIPTMFKRGQCIYRVPGERGWIIDNEIPIFTQDRDFILSKFPPPGEE